MWLALAAFMALGAVEDLPAPRPVPWPFDGDWTVEHLELGGREIPVRNAHLTVARHRLRISTPDERGESDLFLGADNRVHRWAPTPGRPEAICFPFTPRDWAKQFGDPTYVSETEQYVVEPVAANVIKVPPRPFKIIPAVPPSPGPAVGLYVATSRQLVMRLGYSGAGNDLVLVLRRAKRQ